MTVCAMSPWSHHDLLDTLCRQLRPRFFYSSLPTHSLSREPFRLRCNLTFSCACNGTLAIFTVPVSRLRNRRSLHCPGRCPMKVHWTRHAYRCRYAYFSREPVQRAMCFTKKIKPRGDRTRAKYVDIQWADMPTRVL